MSDKDEQNSFSKVKAWPMIEACRIHEYINGKTPEKGFVLFETGYGPSGLPHIGTFGEVVRTCFVQFAFSELAPNIPTKLYCASDDYDGLRKIPINIPNPSALESQIGLPLTKVTDPFETHDSYGENMNSRLKAFLDRFAFIKYEFISATKDYKNGHLNETIKDVVKNYTKLKELILKNIGEERAETYSPLMPISKITGKILAQGVKSVDAETNTINYTDTDGKEQINSVLNGDCKMQWKIDFGARWKTLDVDYEIFGKDHLANQKIYQSVCKILGGRPPLNFCYELFLGEDGSKISKSKGNGITIDEWLALAPWESLSLFMFQKPKTAKRLCYDVIPRAVDEYLTYVTAYTTQTKEEKLENPAHYILLGKMPEQDFSRIKAITYSLLLNLVSACNPENDTVLWGFIERYNPDLSKNQNPFLDRMVEGSIEYYNQFIKPNKVFKTPTPEEREALLALKNKIKEATKEATKPTPQELQNIVYSIGKQFDFEIKLWFQSIYKILFGQSQGPRIGSFIEIYGIENTAQLIDKMLK